MDKYDIEVCIGRGNFGTAHIALDKAKNEKVVIKQIPIELMSDSEKKMAHSEVDLLSSLKHPHIVEYKESFLENEVLSIVMSYCHNGDLAKTIKEKASKTEYFEESQILKWFVQMVSAIQYIHGTKVLHRDLKTNNVFLTKENDVKLGDFGIARVLDTTLEHAKTVVGTPYYMSPEVCENKPYSYASDMWSLGCLLFEMCSLKHAFNASNLLGLVFKIVQHDHLPLPSHCSPEMGDLVNALLRKDPAQRPTTSEVMQFPVILNYLKENPMPVALNMTPAIELNLNRKTELVASCKAGPLSPVYESPLLEENHKQLPLVVGLDVNEEIRPPEVCTESPQLPPPIPQPVPSILSDISTNTAKTSVKNSTEPNNDTSISSQPTLVDEFSDTIHAYEYDYDTDYSDDASWRDSDHAAEEIHYCTLKDSINEQMPPAIVDMSSKLDHLTDKTTDQDDGYYSDDFEADTGMEGEVLLYSVVEEKKPFIKPRKPSLTESIKAIKVYLCEKLGHEVFDAVYVFLRQSRKEGKTNCKAQLIELAGRSKLCHCFEVDQLITMEDSY